MKYKFIGLLLFLCFTPFLVLVDFKWQWYHLAALSVLLFLISYQLLKRFYAPLKALEIGTETLKDGDYSVFLNEQGNSELNRLVQIYNRMVQSLQDQRIEIKAVQQFFEDIVQNFPFIVLIVSDKQTLVYANRKAEQLFKIRLDKYRHLPLKHINHFLIDFLVAKDLSEELIDQFGHKFRVQRSTFFKEGSTHTLFLMEEVTNRLIEHQVDAWKKIVRVVSHELNNTVSPIISIHQSLERYVEPLPDFDTDLKEGIRSASKRLKHLSSFINEYSSIAKLPAVNRKNISVQSFFSQLVRLLNVPSVLFENSTNVEFLFIDEHLFEQALINLLKNAVEACENKPDGKVKLLLTKRENKTTLIIEDNGVGISEDAKANLFVPYFTTKPHGNGIGLSIVQEILHKHGFRFYYESELGKGTKFIIEVR